MPPNPQDQQHQEKKQRRQQDPPFEWFTQRSGKNRRWRQAGKLALVLGISSLVVGRIQRPPRSNNGEARTSRAAGCWPGVGDEAGWGWWWPRARERTGNGGEAFTDVGLDSTERRSEAEGKSKPNVFFIMIDDMGWNDIGYQSTDLHAVTPNLNRMAAAGMRLSQYYSMSICTPARAALMTGRYSIRYGVQYSVINSGAAWGIPLTEKLLPQYMNDAGYTSHMIGKWHLGGHTEAHLPHRRGFETHLGYTFGTETYWTHQLAWNKTPNEAERQRERRETFLDLGFGNETGYYHVTQSPPRPLSPPQLAPLAPGGETSGETVPTGSGHTGASSFRPHGSSSSSSSSSSVEVAGEYSTQIFAARALEVVKAKMPFDESPLFLYLAHQAVHEPLGLPPADSFNAEELAVLDALEDSSISALRLRFAKVLMYLDKTIGQLVDYLEKEGWLDNSVIVVASDNGGCASDGGSNLPLRGVKGSYWEGGVKVPALVYSPSHIPEEQWGKEYAGLMHVTDWLPTIAAAADFEPSGSYGDFDGVSHWETMTSKASLRKNSGVGEGNGDPSSGSSNGAYSPRSEILVNFDPYFLGAHHDDTISDADFAHAVGAFRHGKWKFLFNVCCLGYYDPNSYLSSPKKESASTGEACPQDVGMADKKAKTTTNAAGATSASTSSTTTSSSSSSSSSSFSSFSRCYKFGCAESCVDRSACTDWLFDLEQDPLEEHNLASVYPEVVEHLRERVASVVDKDHGGYSNSTYVGIDPSAYDVWKSHDYWVIPWLLENAKQEAIASVGSFGDTKDSSVGDVDR